MTSPYLFKHALIHVGTALSLEIDDPIHRDLLNIPQYRWFPDDPNNTQLFVQFVQDLLQPETTFAAPESSVNWNTRIQNLSQFINPENWLLTYVGENPLNKLNELFNNFGNSKDCYVPSSYAYWGLCSAYMWNLACNDPASHMSRNIRRFTQYAKPLFEYIVDRQRFNFVSLGVGEGSKDGNIISDFFFQSNNNQPSEDFLYIPVDMSLEMLGLAIEEIRHLPPSNRIAIQRDIETQGSMIEIASIAKTLGQHRPILYGFLGNTISNVEDPANVLRNIAAVMENDDLLLFEARIVDSFVLKDESLQRTIDFVEREYSHPSFRKFAESSLLQYTDLSMTPDERKRSYFVEVCPQNWSIGDLIQIDCFFRNIKSNAVNINLFIGEPITLQPQERIRLYRSRKFVPDTLTRLVEVNGFTNVTDPCLHWNENGTGFMVMLLRCNP